MPRNMDNPTFYKAVCGVQSLQDVRARHGFCVPESDSQRFGAVLKLSKESWLIHLGNRKKTGVHVHFECTRDHNKKCRFHLHIETYPYVESISKKPDVLAQRQPELELRERLHWAIRPALMHIETIKVVTPSARYRPGSPSANSAGKFLPSDLPEDYTVQQYAGFLAKVIEAVVPTVDSFIAKV